MHGLLFGWKWAPFLIPLLAESDGYRRAARHSAASYDSSDLIWLAALVLVPLTILLVVKILQRLAERFQHRSSALFMELCRAHGLGWRDRLRLWQLTRQANINPPTRLFVTPQCMDALLKRGGASPLSSQELQRLRGVLFGDLPRTVS